MLLVQKAQLWIFVVISDQLCLKSSEAQAHQSGRPRSTSISFKESDLAPCHHLYKTRTHWFRDISKNLKDLIARFCLTTENFLLCATHKHTLVHK